MERLRIAVVGAGAVGAYYGGRLAEAGNQVSFYSRSGAMQLRAGGLNVSSIAGDFDLPAVSAFDDTRLMPPAQLVIVSLKSTAIANYVDLVRPLVGEDSIILCLQNGLGNEEIFADAFGPDRVLGATAFTCINRASANRILHTAHGHLKIGAFVSKRMDQAESISSLFRNAKVPAEAVADLRYHRWEKLVWNIPFNGWGAALDLHTAALLGSHEGETLIREMMAEVIRAARALGAELPVSLIDSEINRTRTMGEYHSSMQLDRQQRRRMEVESIVATPFRLATQAGATDLPRMSTMIGCLTAIDQSFA